MLVAFFPLPSPASAPRELRVREDYSKFESQDTGAAGQRGLHPTLNSSGPARNEAQLLPDFKREAGRAYGVLDEEKLFTKRAYFLIGKDGQLRWKHVEAELGHSRPNSELLEAIAQAS